MLMEQQRMRRRRSVRGTRGEQKHEFEFSAPATAKERRKRGMLIGINRINVNDGRLQSSVSLMRGPFSWHFRIELRLIRFLSSCHPHLSSLPDGTEANSALYAASKWSIAAWIGSIGNSSNFRFYYVTPGT